MLPQLKIMIQWIAKERGCECLWDGEKVLDCKRCELAVAMELLIRAGEADGWQIRKFADPLLKYTEPT